MFGVGLGSDRDILQRIRNNDRSVLGDLFIRYQKLIFSYIKTHGGNQDDAEDMLQESIIVLWQKAADPDFQLTAKISTYLMAVAKNKWMSESRKRQRYTTDEKLPERSDNLPDQLEQMVDDEKIEVVATAMKQLNPACQQLLTLFYLEEKSTREIARIMNFANPDVVKAKKYQCKKALQEQLKSVSKTTERGMA